MSVSRVKIIMSNPFYLNSAAELSDLPLFATLDKAQLEEVAPQVKVRQYARNSYIFRPDEENNTMCLLLKGHLKKGIFLPDGKELIRYLVRPMEFFGYDRLTGHDTRPNYAKTLACQATILHIPVQLVDDLMRRNDRFSMAMVELVAKAVRRSESLLDILLTADVRSRVSYFIKENTLSIAGEQPIETMMHEGLTQQDIAQMIGATRQTVALVLNEMRKDNKIDFNRKKIVLKVT